MLLIADWGCQLQVASCELCHKEQLEGGNAGVCHCRKHSEQGCCWSRHQCCTLRRRSSSYRSSSTAAKEGQGLAALLLLQQGMQNHQSGLADVTPHACMHVLWSLSGCAYMQPDHQVGDEAVRPGNKAHILGGRPQIVGVHDQVHWEEHHGSCTDQPSASTCCSDVALLTRCTWLQACRQHRNLGCACAHQWRRGLRE